MNQMQVFCFEFLIVRNPYYICRGNNAKEQLIP